MIRLHQVDVVVVGGGSGGFGAAVAAARAGLEVLVVEASPTIGGNANRCGVSNWEPVAGATGLPYDIYCRLKRIPLSVAISGYGRHFLWDGLEAFPGGERVIVPRRSYRDTLIRHGAPSLADGEIYAKNHNFGVVFEPAAYEAVLFQMLAETGRCRVLTNTTAVDAEIRDRQIASVTLSTGQKVEASYYVDGTGDVEFCRLLGCDIVTGQESKETYNEPSAPEHANNHVNAATLMYRITPKSVASVDSSPEPVPNQCWWADSYPLSTCVLYPNGDRSVNMLPTMDGREYMELGHDAAYAECRRRVYATWRYVQQSYPEFRRYRLHSLAESIGVRESNRVITEHVLTEHDVRTGVSVSPHNDIIAIADHSLDRHGKGGWARQLSEPFGVPYRCLLPKGYRNLAVACRGAGFSSVAASSCRLSRTMMQLGQAVGTAAALAKESAVSLLQVSPASLRSRLFDQNVQLSWPTPKPIQNHLEDVPWAQNAAM